MILASQSPRRIELMRDAGYDITVRPADIDESPHPDEAPFALVERLARMKAAAAHAAAGGDTVVAADTVVVLDDAILGKPADEVDARRMLRALSGRTHQVATGVCIMRGDSISSFVEVTDVTFYELADEEIAVYVASGEPMDKAGAYGIQGSRGRMLVKRIDGDFYNVVGLPIARLVRALEH